MQGESVSTIAHRIWFTLFRRRFGDLTWDAILWISGVLALLAIPLTLAEPHSAAFTGFVLVTIWINGPLSPLLPATYEPVLMLMGRVYPPVLVAALGTAGILCVEYVNYQLYRQVLFIEKLSRVREGRFVRRVVAWFCRAPFLDRAAVQLVAAALLDRALSVAAGGVLGAASAARHAAGPLSAALVFRGAGAFLANQCDGAVQHLGGLDPPGARRLGSAIAAQAK